jgi:hypothetical protein
MSFCTVGITETCDILGIFATARQASEFISTLPDHERGIYYLDAPCNKIIFPKGRLLQLENQNG